MRKTFIGIDPDVEKSGLARVTVNDDKTVIVEVHSFTFAELLDFVESFYVSDNQLTYIVEAGWLNRSNWHLTRGMSIAMAAKMGEAVGRNQQVGHDIVSVIKSCGYKCIEAAPLQKTWKGKDHKITHKELAYFVPVGKGRTNQEERDALLLAWVYAGLPVRVKPTNK